MLHPKIVLMLNSHEVPGQTIFLGPYFSVLGSLTHLAFWNRALDRPKTFFILTSYIGGVCHMTTRSIGTPRPLVESVNSPKREKNRIIENLLGDICHGG